MEMALERFEPEQIYAEFVEEYIYLELDEERTVSIDDFGESFDIEVNKIFLSETGDNNFEHLKMHAGENVKVYINDIHTQTEMRYPAEYPYVAHDTYVSPE